MTLQKHSCRWICAVLAVICCAVLFVSIAGNARATQVEYIEPIWDIRGNPTLDFAVQPIQDDDHDYAETPQEAAAVLLEALKERNTYAVVYLKATSYSRETMSEIFDLAVAHTGNPKEGDYISHQYDGYSARLGGYAIGSMYYLTLEYFVEYFTTKEQEAELDGAVENILNQLNLEDASDYRKVKGVYDWLCQNVTYDYANLDNDEYLLKHSAYAALINRTSVCQGYATAMYRLLLSLDVDVRYVGGIGNGGAHGWNIVKLGDKYYNVDATWDAARTQVGIDYAYFLQNDADFEDHQRDDQAYAFVNTNAYPMAGTSFAQESFTVIFQDVDGRVLSQNTYHYGQTIIPPADPEKATTNGVHYTFLGWDQEVGICEGDQTFTAQYTESYVDFHVYFKDEDGTQLSHEVYHYGDTIVAPEAPVKAADHTYTYTFSGWDADVGACTGDQTFTAVYEKEYIDYLVVFQYEDGTLISQNTYHYGDEVHVPEQVSPPAGQEDLMHDGWDSPITNCDGNKVYTAVFAPVAAAVKGDFDGDNLVTNSDVIYLLWYTLFPGSYPVSQDADFTGDGLVTNQDVIHLLWHTLFPDSYPLT